MLIYLPELIAFSPFWILILTIFIVMVAVSFYRNHFYIFLLSTLGLMLSFLSLFVSYSVVPIYITSLFYLNRYSILYIGMIILSSICTCFFSYEWLKKSYLNKEEFYLLILFSTLGAIGLIASNHLASIFINIELISLPIFGLIAYSYYHKYALEASLKYIILSGVASSFFLLGIAWIYSITGSISLLNINQYLYVLSNHSTLVILFGLFMMLFSFCFKLSLVPFHLWTADIYQGSPALVLSFFTNISKISMMFIVLRFFSYISCYENSILYSIVLMISVLSMLFGNIMALFQNNIKRLFGYSSISQFGYIFIVLLVSQKYYLFSLEAIGIYLISYFLSNVSFFGLITLLSDPNKKYDHDSIFLYQGLFWKKPFLAGIITVILLSLSGIPLTLGFIGKFYLLSIIIREHLWFLGASFLISTLIGIYCYLRLIFILYSHADHDIEQNIYIFRSWIYTFSISIVFISSFLLLMLGIFPDPLIKLVQFFVYH